MVKLIIDEDRDSWTFPGGNKYLKSNTSSKEEAIRLYNTLSGCTDCLQCESCIDCDGCVGSVGCKSCSQDVLGKNLTKSFGCFHCIDCIDCVDSSYIKRCDGCRSCNGCEDCKSCIDCDSCKNLTNKYRLRYIYSMDEVIHKENKKD